MDESQRTRLRRSACAGPASAGWIVVLLLLAVGCSSSSYLSVRRAPRNPLAGPLNLVSRQGPQPTSRTRTLLRRYDLASAYKQDAPQVLHALHEEVETEPTAEKVYAVAELAYVQGKKAEALLQHEEALSLYGASVAHAYKYLFDPKYDRFRNPYDPQFRRACDLYNGGLEAALRIVKREGNLTPGETQIIDAGDQEFHVDIEVRGKWRAEEFEKLEFCSDYEVEGLNNRHHNYGLGVPMIAVRRRPTEVMPVEQFYPPGLSVPVTAFLRVLPEERPRGESLAAYEAHLSDEPTKKVWRCVLELHDPLAGSDVHVAGRRAPLETDVSTPLAYFLDHPAMRERSAHLNTLNLLNLGGEPVKGLFMLEPYDPNKIPVLMVHGLWSSPLTWMEMFNDLRSMPELHDRYQFWFYLYPTGQPFWTSAAQLRDDLAHVRRTLDPQHNTPALDQMVLVGHSMGGLVSRMQTIDSGDDFWRLVSDRPFSELEAAEEDKQHLADVLFFRPNPSIKRVITLGTPHRGSSFANETTRTLGRLFIQLPTQMVQTSADLLRGNPGFFRNTELMTITTSIDSLAPDSPIFPVMHQAPKAPWVTYHNIVGDIPDEGFLYKYTEYEGDGVVSLASARMNDVASQITVEADHSRVHTHPRSILEVRRILLQHLHQVDRQIAESPRGPLHAPHRRVLHEAPLGAGQGRP